MLEDADFFWTQVALDISRQYGQGHPSTWDKPKIDAFLEHLEEELIGRCRDNEKLARVFDLPVRDDGEVNLQALKILGYDAFRRIFITKESSSKSYNKKLFAVYFNYFSFQEYIEDKKVSAFETLPQIPSYLLENQQLSPYPGLKTFTYKDCHLFHGRIAYIKSLLRYLHHIDLYSTDIKYKDLILLYGQTGVGKSSLIHAGLIPRLLEHWDVLYAKRDYDSRLKNTFNFLASPQPVLLLFDQLHLLAAKSGKELQTELESLMKVMENDMIKHAPGDMIIIVAAPVQVSKYLSSLENWKDSNQYLPKQEGETDEAYVNRLVQVIRNSTQHFFLINSLGKKHNLWHLLYPLLRNQYLIRYGAFEADRSSLTQLYEKMVQPRRKLIILDQVEEAITRPRAKNQAFRMLGSENLEIKNLAKAIAEHLSKHDCKIILSFRADYLAEIENVFEQNLLNSYKKWLIKPLDEQGVKDAIEQPLQPGYFELKYYPDFVTDMIHLLKNDSESNIAPALQIILKRLWDEVKLNNRHITREVFEKQVKNERKIIKSFLLEQLQTLERDTHG